LTYFSASEPAWVLITVAKLSSRERAFGDNEVGAEYLRRNSLTPLRKFSMLN